MSKKIKVIISDSMYEELELLSRIEGKTTSELVNYALEDHFHNPMPSAVAKFWEKYRIFNKCYFTASTCLK